MYEYYDLRQDLYPYGNKNILIILLLSDVDLSYAITEA